LASLLSHPASSPCRSSGRGGAAGAGDGISGGGTRPFTFWAAAARDRADRRPWAGPRAPCGGAAPGRDRLGQPRPQRRFLITQGTQGPVGWPKDGPARPLIVCPAGPAHRAAAAESPCRARKDHPRCGGHRHPHPRNCRNGWRP
jgi:hypothetical protein